MSQHLTFRLSPHSDRITLSSGKLCPSEALCETAPQTFLWNTNYPSGTLGPFVVYDNQFYYILESLPDLNNTDNSSIRERQIIELYVMEDCQSRFPIFNTSIDLTQCSRNLSVILDEPYPEDTRFVMGTHMTMVDTSQERIFLFVLFQFDNNTSGGNVNCAFTTTAKLYSVYESGNSELLSEIALTNCWNPDAVAAVPGIGGVSYYPGKVRVLYVFHIIGSSTVSLQYFNTDQFQKTSHNHSIKTCGHVCLKYFMEFFILTRSDMLVSA